MQKADNAMEAVKIQHEVLLQKEKNIIALKQNANPEAENLLSDETFDAFLADSLTEKVPTDMSMCT